MRSIQRIHYPCEGNDKWKGRIPLTTFKDALVAYDPPLTWLLFHGLAAAPIIALILLSRAPRPHPRLSGAFRWPNSSPGFKLRRLRHFLQCCREGVDGLIDLLARDD